LHCVPGAHLVPHAPQFAWSRIETCATGACTCGAPPLLECAAGLCSDTSSDPQNCGMCGKVCQSGSNCVASACTCLPNRPDCAGTGLVCNLVKDNDNCGACGTVCTGGMTCKGGTCKL